MVITSLIFLLLSNSITLRRDKSILYSRASITISLAAIDSGSIFIFLSELVHYTKKSMSDMDFSWTTALLFSSLLSLVVGTVVGLTQSSIKRLFAFSTISHVGFSILSRVGFIFLGLSIHTIESTQAFMPLVAILTSVISAVYYLAIIKQIFFDKPDYTVNEELTNLHAEGLLAEKNTINQKVDITINNIVLSSSLSLSISIITLVIALFIFIPEELLSLANILALILFNI